MNKNNLLKIISGFSLLGILAAAYALYEFYFGTAESVCNINSKFSCTLVNQSGYADIFGIPVSVFGIVGYLAIFSVSLLALRGRINNHDRLLMLLTVPAVLFSAYLAYVSAFVVNVWCPTCIVSYVTILVLFVLSVLLKRQVNR